MLFQDFGPPNRFFSSLCPEDKITFGTFCLDFNFPGSFITINCALVKIEVQDPIGFLFCALSWHIVQILLTSYFFYLFIRQVVILELLVLQYY